MFIAFPHLPCKLQNMKTSSDAICDIDQPSAVEIHIVGLNHLFGSLSPILLHRRRDIMAHLIEEPSSVKK